MIRLLPVRLTLFTRTNCSLCTEASGVVARALRQIEPRRPEYQTIDIDDPRYKQKWSIYDFDVPVVCPLHNNINFNDSYFLMMSASSTSTAYLCRNRANL